MIPVVLVPGLLCTAEIFAPQIAALWRFGPVTVASTLGGDTMAEIARSILRHAPPRFALAGISMGGYISFEIMRQAPERVVKLALLDTSAREDTPQQTEGRRTLVAQTRAGDFEALVGPVLASLLHPTRRDDPELREINARMARTVGLEGFARQQEAIIGRIDSLPSATAISVPTLVLVGNEDLLTPPERAEEIVAAIPDARLVVVPRCGHCSTIEQPEIVNRAMVEWISG